MVNDVKPCTAWMIEAKPIIAENVARAKYKSITDDRFLLAPLLLLTQLSPPLLPRFVAGEVSSRSMLFAIQDLLIIENSTIFSTCRFSLVFTELVLAVMFMLWWLTVTMIDGEAIVDDVLRYFNVPFGFDGDMDRAKIEGHGRGPVITWAGHSPALHLKMYSALLYSTRSTR